MGVEFGRGVWTGDVLFRVMSLAGGDRQSCSPREVHVHREEVLVIGGSGDAEVTGELDAEVTGELLWSGVAGVKLGKNTEICW